MLTEKNNISHVVFPEITSDVVLFNKDFVSTSYTIKTNKMEVIGLEKSVGTKNITKSRIIIRMKTMNNVKIGVYVHIKKAIKQSRILQYQKTVYMVI